MASEVAHKNGYHIIMCDTQLETAYGNGQMQIQSKKLRNRHSVITNIERKMKALGS